MAQLDRWIISTFAYCAKNKDEKTNFQSRLPFVSPDTWATSSVGMLMCQSCKIKHSSRLIQTPVLFLAQKGKTSLLAIFLQTDFFLCRTLAKWVSTSKSMSITWHNEWCAFGETYLISFFFPLSLVTCWETQLFVDWLLSSLHQCIFLESLCGILVH